MDGVIVVDKPAGWTSHDVVNKMRRIAGTKKIGHLGTLDPLATGVLPLVIGRATQKGTQNGKSMSASIRFSRVCVKEKGKCVAVSTQNTPVAM